jgi:hypothetical protein
MAIQPESTWSPYSMNGQSFLKSSAEKGFSLKSSTSANSSSGTSGMPLVDTFNQILQEAVSGLTQVAGRVASKKVSDFVSHHDKLGAIAQAAGWVSPSGSTGSSSSSSSGSSSSTGTAGNDPVTRLMDALGQTVNQTMQQAQQGMSDLGAFLAQQIQTNLANQLSQLSQGDTTNQNSTGDQTS